MNYLSMLSYMKEEISLIVVIVLILLMDLIVSDKRRNILHYGACILMLAHIAINICPSDPAEAFGGMYQYTPMMTIIKSILSIGTLIVFLQADVWLKREDTKFKRGEFYTLTLSTLLGMYFMISSGHFLMFFIGLELASIPMAALVAFDKYKHNSAEAGAKYILSAAFSSGIMLYGISMIYGTVGSLYFDDIPMQLLGTPLQILAMVFFFAGMGFKISLVPFHLWTADTYQGAPTNVTSYLSVISKGAAVFVLMTIFIKVFANMIEHWQTMLYGIIIVTITVANLFALRQQNLKRFLAFSSVSQAGYIMLGVIGGNPEGMTSLVYYVLVYMVANLAIFGIVNIIEQKSGKININDYNGLYKTNPRLSFVMMLALFSLAGIPPFAGFFSKFFIFMSAFKAGYVWLVFIALVNTVISLYYYLLIIRAMYIRDSEDPVATIKTDVWTKVSLIICTGGIVLIGLLSFIFDYINNYGYGMN